MEIAVGGCMGTAKAWGRGWAWLCNFRTLAEVGHGVVL